MPEKPKQQAEQSRVSRRGFITRALPGAAGSYLLLKTSRNQQARAAEALVADAPVVPAGHTYAATVPDTLDLAERARLALNCLTGALDPADRGGVQYEIYFLVRFAANPAFMYHEASGLPTINPKFAESMPLMRVMCGSDYNLDVERAMMESMLRWIEPPGLFYAHHTKLRPWDQSWNPVSSDFANVYGNSRMILAMMAWYQRDRNPEWKKRIDAMVAGLSKIAINRGNYAYFPDDRFGESFSYPISGWRTTAQSKDIEFGIPMYHGGAPRAGAGWYRLGGTEQSLELARKITNYLMLPRMWGNVKEPQYIQSANLAHWSGQFHAHAMALRGILDYAWVTNDADLKRFVRNGYEYSRTFGVPLLGWFPEISNMKMRPCESCDIADMVALAVKLSDAGVGDYWDDVDQYVRNQLVEQQLTDADALHSVSEHGPKATIDSPRQTSDRVIERNLGGFVGHGNLTDLPKTWIMHCCTGNSTEALYYAWEAITRFDGTTAQVNLLLNRAAPWLDLNSYLPFEGKIAIKNKKAARLSIRIPQWVDRRTLRCTIGAQQLPQIWAGNYLLVERLRPHDEVTLTFKVPKRTVKFTWYGETYTAEMKGSTVIDISPREESPIAYPIYRRKQYRADQAPMKKTSRYVASLDIWPST